VRVLHVIPSLSTLRGGPSVAVRTLAQSLASAGLEVHIAATDDDGPGRSAVPHATPLRDGAVTYWHFPRQTHFYTVSLPLARWLWRNVASYDLVHAHALFSFAPLAAAAAAAAHGVPFILRPLGTLSPYGMGRRRLGKRLSFHLIERHALSAAAAVHFTSEQECREAASLGVRFRPAIVPLPVPPPAVDLAHLRGRFRAAHPALAAQPLALFLGRIDPKKGLDLLLPALAAARGRGTSLALAIVGAADPPYLAQLQASAAALGLGPEALVWTGFLEGEARLAALADADLFVLPSYAENFGVAVVEAMAAGLPVIVSDQVGIQHEIAAAGAGIVVPCNAAALADALAALVGDPARRVRMGEAARHLAAERFAPHTVAAQLIRLYVAVADMPGQRRTPLKRDRLA